VCLVVGVKFMDGLCGFVGLSCVIMGSLVYYCYYVWFYGLLYVCIVHSKACGFIVLGYR